MVQGRRGWTGSAGPVVGKLSYEKVGLQRSRAVDLLSHCMSKLQRRRAAEKQSCEEAEPKRCRAKSGRVAEEIFKEAELLCRTDAERKKC